MKKLGRNGSVFIFGRFNSLLSVAAVTIAFLAANALTAQAQTFNVIYSFGGGGDGANPTSGVTLDQRGNLYGTAYRGGTGGVGTVYELTKRSNGSWFVKPLHQFQQSNGDGILPYGGVVFGSDGRLYGMTSEGGIQQFWGVVYSLSVRPRACGSVLCPWLETIIYRFTGGADGGQPGFVNPVFDQAGNLYGTTETGGAMGGGTVFKLTPSNGTWTESVLHSFGSDGAFSPDGTLAFDRSGNIYGTTGGATDQQQGAVYQLTPSGSGWTLNILHVFQGGSSDGARPWGGGVVFDQAGNFYGGTIGGGVNGAGVIYEFSPSGSGFTFSLPYAGFDGGEGPSGTLVMDVSGNLYGTTLQGGSHSMGSVFKLTPGLGGWTYTTLHDFTGGSDGSWLYAGPTLDANGNLYGTAAMGGAYGNGVIWEITP